jgi:hypothetical protein
VKLSRETINNVLAKNKQNGYEHEFKRWEFFQSKEPDERWHIDFKGPLTVQGKKYWFLVCIDDARTEQKTISLFCTLESERKGEYFR